jgi:ribosomal protein S18 acetylase RimI-like enzyme
MENILFRTIRQSDFEEIKKLHELFFPVRYTDAFFVDACEGKGVNNGNLQTTIATKSSRIIGFIFSQFLKINESEEYHIVQEDSNISESLYILTLGVSHEYRRTGIATKLLNECINLANSNKKCGVVYLHTIHTNLNAICFYEKNNFEFFQQLPGRGTHCSILNCLSYTIVHYFLFSYTLQDFMS